MAFSPVPRTGRATFEASGSLVSLSLRLWPIEMDIHMASLAYRYTFAFAFDHMLHPQRFLPSSLFVQVCQFSYVMHLDFFFALTYFTGVL